MNIFEYIELLKGLGYMTAYVTAALPCRAAANGASLLESFSYDLLKPNVIVKIRTGKVNGHFKKLFPFFFLTLAGLLLAFMGCSGLFSPCHPQKVYI